MRLCPVLRPKPSHVDRPVGPSNRHAGSLLFVVAATGMLNHNLVCLFMHPGHEQGIRERSPPILCHCVVASGTGWRRGGNTKSLVMPGAWLRPGHAARRCPHRRFAPVSSRGGGRRREAKTPSTTSALRFAAGPNLFSKIPMPVPPGLDKAKSPAETSLWIVSRAWHRGCNRHDLVVAPRTAAGSGFHIFRKARRRDRLFEIQARPPAPEHPRKSS